MENELKHCKSQASTFSAVFSFSLCTCTYGSDFESRPSGTRTPQNESKHGKVLRAASALHGDPRGSRSLARIVTCERIAQNIPACFLSHRLREVRNILPLCNGVSQPELGGRSHRHSQPTVTMTMRSARINQSLAGTVHCFTHGGSTAMNEQNKHTPTQQADWVAIQKLSRPVKKSFDS